MKDDWAAGKWTTAPVGVEATSDGLRVEAASGSDFWRETFYGFVHDKGHALLAPLPPGRALEVSFDLGGLTELYDQAGLFVCAGPETWLKAGVEINDGVPHVAAVVTDATSDWSLSPVPDWGGTVTVRMSPVGNAAVIRARTETAPWRTIRVAPNIASDALSGGPMVCSPTRSGLIVTFRHWRDTAPDVDLHTDPPR